MPAATAAAANGRHTFTYERAHSVLQRTSLVVAVAVVVVFFSVVRELVCVCVDFHFRDVHNLWPMRGTKYNWKEHTGHDERSTGRKIIQ